VGAIGHPAVFIGCRTPKIKLKNMVTAVYFYMQQETVWQW